MGSRPLRRLDQPRPLTVVVSPGGLPHALTVRGRRRPVIAIRDDWLVQDRWWTDAPVDRHYHELVIEPGRLIIVFQDLHSGGWFTHDQGSAPADHVVRPDDPAPPTGRPF